MNINLYESETGHSPLEAFLMSQSPDVTVRLMKDITHFSEKGLALMATDKLTKFRGQDNLYELRTRYRGIAYRILFTMIDDVAWLLHGFIKKSQKTPQREINTALQRKGALQQQLSKS